MTKKILCRKSWNNIKLTFYMPDKNGMCIVKEVHYGEKYTSKRHISDVRRNFERLTADITSTDPFFYCSIYLCLNFGEICKKYI